MYAEMSTVTNVDVADLSRALSCIAEWADMWQLQIFVTKCCATLEPQVCLQPSETTCLQRNPFTDSSEC